MWCLKCFGKTRDRTLVISQMRDNQIFQNWIFIIHGYDELLKSCRRCPKANMTDTIVLLESEDCSLFVISGDVVIIMNEVIDDEWKGR